MVDLVRLVESVSDMASCESSGSPPTSGVESSPFASAASAPMGCPRTYARTRDGSVIPRSDR